MYMFDVNRRYDRPYNRPILSTNSDQTYMYIPVSHTNRRSIRNRIGVMNCLMGQNGGTEGPERGSKI